MPGETIDLRQLLGTLETSCAYVSYGTLEFFKDGKSMGVAMKDFPIHAPLYPFFRVH
jgi:hypothetical protein